MNGEVEKIKEKIIEIKRRLGDELLILTHHYQRQEVVDVGDAVGDSLILARKGAENKKARFIVFCGVHFMAEASRILAGPTQRVFMPEPKAGCPMADMADLDDVQNAYAEISQRTKKKVVPVVYINSNAEIKAFCGKEGGSICTSSNARTIMEWALQNGDKVLFLPDAHLGINSADALGIEDVAVWDPFKEEQEWDEINKAKVIVWNGYCHVHTFFRPEHVSAIREKYPGCKVVVHPECPREVVKLSDAVGSTAFIVRYVRQAEPGSCIAIGTEINLVKRLAKEQKDKKIVPLDVSLCPNMYKTTLDKLLRLLEKFPASCEIDVDEEVERYARVALDKMLELS